MESKTKKKLAFLLLKILVSGGLLFYVFRKAGMQNIAANLRSVDPRYFLLSMVIYVFVVYVAALRWRLLLEHKYAIGKLFSLYFIGSFFNNILPGAIGGDAVKIYYLYKDSGKGGNSLGSVFLDRYMGLLALLLVGMIAGIIAFDDLKAVRMQWVIPLLFSAYLAGSILFFGFRIGKRFKALSTLYEYVHLYLGRKRVLVSALALSLIIQMLSIAMVYVIALGLDQKLSFAALFVFVPIIVTVTTIPISISGLGVRETAFVALFGLTGVPHDVSMSISFLWFLSIAATSLVGLVEYARYRKGGPAESPVPGPSDASQKDA